MRGYRPAREERAFVGVRANEHRGVVEAASLVQFILIADNNVTVVALARSLTERGPIAFCTASADCARAALMSLTPSLFR